MQKNRYQLRCAAGKYWLLDMEQDGETYRPPLMLNESGGLYLQAVYGRKHGG